MHSNVLSNVGQTEINKASDKTRRIGEFCQANKIQTIALGTPLYPSSFLDLKDCPSIFYLLGEAAFLSDFEKNVAIVGTRTAQPFYLKSSEKIAKRVCDQGFNVISGLALGCDTAAHKGSLLTTGNGQTAAILASGLDNIAPRQNKQLAQDIIASGGCLISEKAPFETTQKYDFVRRNRLQAAASQRLIVVEADENSGTMTTATKGIELQRSIGVVSPDQNAGDREIPSGNAKLLDQGAENLINHRAVDIFLASKTPPSEKQEELFN